VRRLDVLALLLCGLAMLVGPVMALQELSKANDAAAAGLVIDPSAAPRDLDAGFRLAWRTALVALILAIDVVGSVVMLRIGRQPRVRAVSGRLLGLLVFGLAWLDLAFLVDARYLFAAPYAERALIVSWLYLVGAVFVAGSVFRLGDVESLLRHEPAPAAHA
jgi:hypothetical protein